VSQNKNLLKLQVVKTHKISNETQTSSLAFTVCATQIFCCATELTKHHHRVSSDTDFLLSDKTNESSATKTQNRQGFVEAPKKSSETRTHKAFVHHKFSTVEHYDMRK